MPSVGLIKTTWTGTSGGPGVTTMAMTNTALGDILAVEAQEAVNRVRTFWDTLKANLPNELSLTVLPTVDSFDAATGVLTSSAIAATPPLPVVGTNAAGYHSAAGARVDWETGVIANGRRVRGRTYLVPYTASAYNVDGLLLPAQQTTIQTAANALLAGMVTDGNGLVVWQRPQEDPVRAGAAYLATTSRVPSKAAVLRSRRD